VTRVLLDDNHMAKVDFVHNYRLSSWHNKDYEVSKDKYFFGGL
jgi:hypothetical protein